MSRFIRHSQVITPINLIIFAIGKEARPRGAFHRGCKSQCKKQSDDENDAEDTTSSSASERENKMARLNEYYHLLQEKLNVKLELYKIDSVLDDYLSLSKKYLNLIETDSWPSMDLSNAFEWLSDRFLRKLIQMSAQIDAKDYLCPEFVLIFRNFTLLFAIDCEFIKSKVSCIFVLYSSGALIFLVKQIKY